MTACIGDQFASCSARDDCSSEPLVSTWSAAFSDPDEQAASIPLYPQSYDQLGCGRFAGEMATVDLGGVVIVRERLNRRVLQTGVISSVSLAWAWQRSNRYRTNGVEHTDDCMFFYGADEEFDILCDPCEMVAISLSEQMMADWFGQPVDSIDPGLFRGARHVPLSIAIRLRSSVSTALDVADGKSEPNAFRDPLSRDSLRDELLQAVTAVAELPGKHGGCTRRCERTYERVVRSARQFAMLNSPRELSLQEVYEHVGVSRRNLHYAFDAVMGISPGQYLRSLRLNAARRDIKRWNPSTSSLADIAANWGFWHPSHFAADYKRRFGELPSETAHRRAPGRSSASDERADRT